MNRLKQKLQTQSKRKNRIRSVVSGTGDRPRMTVFISNKHVSAQLIDDTSHKTLAYVTTVGHKSKELEKSTLTDKATWVGSEIAKKAKSLKHTQIVLDRNGRLYHGRVKALADAARENGMEF